MATTVLESSAVSAFCESVAIMLAAGIQTDEAVSLLGENMEDGRVQARVRRRVQRLIVGEPLAARWTIQDASPATSWTWWAQARWRAALSPRCARWPCTMTRKVACSRRCARDRLPRRAAVRHVRHPGLHRGRDPTRVRGRVREPVGNLAAGSFIRGRIHRHRLGRAGRYALCTGSSCWASWPWPCAARAGAAASCAWPRSCPSRATLCTSWPLAASRRRWPLTWPPASTPIPP